MTGNIERKSTIFELISKYVKKITFGKRPKGLEYSYVFNELPEQFHFALLNQYL